MPPSLLLAALLAFPLGCAEVRSPAAPVPPAGPDAPAVPFSTTADTPPDAETTRAGGPTSSARIESGSQQPRRATNQAAAKPAQVMITLRPAPPAIWAGITLEIERTYRMRALVSWSLQSLGERCIVFEPPPDRPVEMLLRRLASDPRVELVQLVQRFDTLGARSDDASIPLQHSARVLHLEQAHRWSTGKGVRLAIVDTGIDLGHPDLRGRIVKVHNFVDRGEKSFTSDIHGTAVAGVIAAAANVQLGLVGVAPQVEIFALKACWQERAGAREAICDSYTLAKAIDFAIAQGAQILNFSLSGPSDPLLAKLLAAAMAHGIVVVAAVGPDAARSFPATLPGVIQVAGSDDIQGGLRFPTRKVDSGTLAAPGVDILTTVPHGHYDFFSGASFAAAQVSGIAALLLEREPHLSPAQLGALFHKTARPIPIAAGDPTPSVDQVDACAALAASLGRQACS
ncbi:MAG TPA: S8 family serine peptidase [Thermoanaerobaculia bacterium]|nr:S8 family serine peptidase [Thermoanaerobaculia bacterium]